MRQFSLFKAHRRAVLGTVARMPMVGESFPNERSESPRKLVLLVIALVIFHIGAFIYWLLKLYSSSRSEKKAQNKGVSLLTKMMLTAVPTSTAAFTGNPSGALAPNPSDMDKVTAATVTPQLFPVAAMPPPHFLISPGTGYTLVPSVTPLNGRELFGNITSLHQMGQFSGVPRPVGAIPYYNAPVDLYQTGQHGSPSQSSEPAHTTPPTLHVSRITGSGSPDSRMDASSVSDGANNGSPRNLTESISGSCEELSKGGGSPAKTVRVLAGEREVRERSVDIKRESMVTEEVVLPNCTRRNSDSNVEEVSSSAAKNCYPINALIDVPTSLTRSSRTSSLSSSLSSFRFGGSLSQRWASQLSLSKLPNIKSTGNLNADSAGLPSLGNQYFAFGGSLPELSLTSLTRLLPNSSANDSSISSCPSLFTLFHSPLYVYPSQQHLATPFINANGSISFGSFLSSGTSLCSMPKSSPSSENSSTHNTTNGSNMDITSSENKVDASPGAYRQSPVSSSHSIEGMKMAAYPPITTPLLGAAAATPHVFTALPAFNTITRNIDRPPIHSESITDSGPSPIFSTSATTHVNVAATNLNTLACVATAQQQRITSEAQPTISSASPIGSLCHSGAENKDGMLLMSAQPTELYMTRQKPTEKVTPGPATMNGIKLEGDPCLSSTSASRSSELLPSTHTQRTKKERERPYKCNHPGCERSFSFPAHLKSHVQQIHISFRPCKCEFPGCGKRFYTPQHLNVHRRVHTGERPFVCPYTDCSKAFTTAGNLKNHIRTHTGERPYACRFEGCTKRFAEMSSLKKHELTHTGEKPYKCRVCGKAFSQAGSRNTHERKHSRSEEEDSTDGGKVSRRYRIKRIQTMKQEELSP